MPISRRPFIYRWRSIDDNVTGNMGYSSRSFQQRRTTTHEVQPLAQSPRPHLGDTTCKKVTYQSTPTWQPTNRIWLRLTHYSTCSGTPREMTTNYMDYRWCLRYMFSGGQKTGWKQPLWQEAWKQLCTIQPKLWTTRPRLALYFYFSADWASTTLVPAIKKHWSWLTFTFTNRWTNRRRHYGFVFLPVKARKMLTLSCFAIQTHWCTVSVNIITTCIPWMASWIHSSLSCCSTSTWCRPRKSWMHPAWCRGCPSPAWSSVPPKPSSHFENTSTDPDCILDRSPKNQSVVWYLSATFAVLLPLSSVTRSGTNGLSKMIGLWNEHRQ